MRAPTHLAAGSLVGAGWVVTLGADASPLVAVAAAGYGALIPDIDHPGSWIGRRFPFVSLPLSAWLGHRGVTHSLFAAVVCLVTALTLGPVGTLIGLGYLSHLLLDWMTPSGVPLMWPRRDAFRAPMTIRTGGKAEFIFSGVLWAFVFVLLVPGVMG